jgi:PD-(D/E)XK endonuclease
MGRAFSFGEMRAQHMAKCKGFRTFKERGEWVELQFMARALRKGFRVSKPWGDSSPYDVGVEHREQFLRVQVKSTSYRLANGYLCGFKPNQTNKSRYTTRKVDFFAALIVPEDVWYVIPAFIVLKTKSSDLMLCPVQPMRRDCYKYEGYREAWNLLRSGPKSG